MATGDALVRTLLLIVVIVLLVPVLLLLVMVPMMGVWGGHMWNGRGSTGAIWLLLPWLVFLASLFGGGYLLYRALDRSGGRDVDPALEELRIAYARGELSDEEFEQRRERLRRES